MSKVCLRCQTENKDNFSYCKYCGAPLPMVESSREVLSPDTVTETEGSAEVVTDLELENFVGAGAKRIMPKFLTIRRSSRKIFFCLPVILLGFFAGCFGMAAYFFSRKMTKVGIILTLCGILIVGGELALNFEAEKQLLNQAFAVYTAAFENIDDPNVIETLEKGFEVAYTEYLENYNPIPGLVDSYVARSILPVFLSFYAAYIYYTTAIARIGSIKEAIPEGEKRQRAIKKAGGFSVGMIFIPIAASLLMFLIRVILLLL